MPDLQARFVIGAKANNTINGENIGLSNTGGKNSFTVTEALIEHSHNLSSDKRPVGVDGSEYHVQRVNDVKDFTNFDVPTIPPYIAMNYIIKVK